MQQQGDCHQLVLLLKESVERNRTDALLLSGGLDSSILASILRPDYSVTAGFSCDAPDLEFARKVAKKYSKRHVEVFFEDRMVELAEQVIRIFKTFDPIEIRNSVVALAGIGQAKSDGFSSIMTGDGGDELFAGYNYLSRYYSDPEKLGSELRRLWEIMHFSSKKLGEHVGVDVKTPFLDDTFSQFAKSLDARDKVGERDGRQWGKFVLRKCYEAELGQEVAWRLKLAQEQGAATDRFEKYVGQMIDDLTFSNRSKTAQSEGVRIRSKEHLHYYALFRSYFQPPKEEEEDCELRCPECSACFSGNNNSSKFCRTCGAFPVTPVKK